MKALPTYNEYKNPKIVLTQSWALAFCGFFSVDFFIHFLLFWPGSRLFIYMIILSWNQVNFVIWPRTGLFYDFDVNKPEKP